MTDTQEAMREEFEKAYAGLNFKREGDGYYYLDTAERWDEWQECWQAATAQSAEKIARLEAEKEVMREQITNLGLRHQQDQQQLAAAERSNKQLRDACDKLDGAVEEYEGDDGNYMGVDMDDWHEFIESTAQQPSTEALDAYVAKETGALQAKIDRLMLEHCPDEMTPEQLEEWGKHQVSASPELTAQVEASLPPSPEQKGWRR